MGISQTVEDIASQLPRGLPRLPCDKDGKPYRAAHGDLLIEYHDDGSVRYIQAQIRNVMTYLHEHGTLDDSLLEAGQRYEHWRLIYLANHDFIRRAPAERGEIGNSIAEWAYTLLLVRMEKRHHDNIQQALEIATGHRRFVADRCRTQYRISFQRLADLIPDVLATIEHRQKQIA